MTAPRVGMRTPSRMPAASVLRSTGSSAQELAHGAHQALGVELEVGAPLGDATLVVDEHDEATVHDALARHRVEAEGADHTAYVVGCTGQEIPAREVETVRLGVAPQHLGAVGGRVERDRHEA